MVQECQSQQRVKDILEQLLAFISGYVQRKVTEAIRVDFRELCIPCVIELSGKENLGSRMNFTTRKRKIVLTVL